MQFYDDGRPFTWFFKHGEGENDCLQEYDGKQWRILDFNKLPREQLKSFGLLGADGCCSYNTHDGTFEVFGHTISMKYDDKVLTAPLGQGYRNVISYKDAMGDLMTGAVCTLAYVFGYKQLIEMTNNSFYLQPLLKRYPDGAAHLEVRLVSKQAQPKGLLKVNITGQGRTSTWAYNAPLGAQRASMVILDVKSMILRHSQGGK